MTNENERVPFYNKIFFCDIIGFSQRDALGQVACQRRLDALVRDILGRLGTRLEEDVIALPTGDGMALNFLGALPPDVHLRTALMLLESHYSTNESESDRFGLRIGLNSFVDTWVRDINGKRNVVGSGINMAQRVMDIGRHGQVLMHGQVHTDLENYPQHAEKLIKVGDFTVKHGKVLQVSQYFDPTLHYLTNQLVEPQRPGGPAAFDFDDILKSRVTEQVLQLHLDRRAFDNMAIVREFIEEFLDRHQALQERKVWITWIASELIENAFRYNPSVVAHGVDLTVARTRMDVLIRVTQPPFAGFDLSSVLADRDKSGSFMQMMAERGLKWRTLPSDDHFILELELPDSLSPTAYAGPENVPAVRAFASVEPIHRSSPTVEICKGVALLSPQTAPEGIVESNFTQFDDWLLHSIEALPTEVHAIVLDLGAVSYISSRGLRSLTRGRLAASQRGSLEIAIVVNSPSLWQLFEISRYDRLFRVFRNIPTALAAIDPA